MLVTWQIDFSPDTEAKKTAISLEQSPEMGDVQVRFKWSEQLSMGREAPGTIMVQLGPVDRAME